MTNEEREEALAIMNVIIHMIEKQYDNDRVEKAVDTAIAALKQPTDGIYITHKVYSDLCLRAAKAGDLERELAEKKAEPCGDAVSREFMYKLGAKCIAVRTENDVLVAIASIESLPSVTPARKTGDFTRQELENWLYSICLNNVGTDFCKDIEEIISRLDGFERYVEDIREAANESCC